MFLYYYCLMVLAAVPAGVASPAIRVVFTVCHPGRSVPAAMFGEAFISFCSSIGGYELIY